MNKPIQPIIGGIFCADTMLVLPLSPSLLTATMCLVQESE